MRSSLLRHVAFDNMSNGDDEAMASMDIIGITTTKGVEQQQLQAYYVICTVYDFVFIIMSLNLTNNCVLKKVLQEELCFGSFKIPMQESNSSSYDRPTTISGTLIEILQTTSYKQ